MGEGGKRGGGGEGGGEGKGGRGGGRERKGGGETCFSSSMAQGADLITLRQLIPSLAASCLGQPGYEASYDIH